VIGAAGCIGSSIAFNIASQELADEMVLADIRKDWLEHHSIDVFDATVVKHGKIDVRMGDHEDIAGSDIVIMAAGVNSDTKTRAEGSRIYSRQSMLPDNLGIIKEWAQAINSYCPEAIVITATNPAEVLNYASYLSASSKKRHRFIGYSLNDTVRFKVAISRVLGIKLSKIDAPVLGEHGGSMVPIFSSVKSEGTSLDFNEDQKAKIIDITNDYLAHMLRLQVARTSGWLTGTGMASIVKAIVHDTKEVIPCCAVLDGEYGYQGTSIGVPVVLGREGILKIIEYELTTEEKQLLDNSVDNIKPSVDYVLDNIQGD